MEQLKFRVANDNGNSEQDMFINDVEIASPNVFARALKLPNLDEINPKDVMSDIHNHLLVKIDDQHYYIGDYALRSGNIPRSIDVGADNDKMDSDIVYINTLAHIAGEAAHQAYENGLWTDSVVPVDVQMATSLPVVSFSSDAANRFAHKFMDNDQIVSVYVGSEAYKVVIHFSFVKVIPEGVTASHALTHRDTLFKEYNKLHTDDQLTSSDFKHMRILHVAIGEGTTEFPITEGIVYNPNYIDGTKNGVGVAIDRVIEDFKDRVGLRTLTRQAFSAIIRDKDHRYHDIAAKMFQPAIEDEAAAIFNRTKFNVSKANNEVDVVAVYGGGSILMRDALEAPLQKFCDRRMIKLLYITNPQDAVFMESYGLRDFVSDKLFENIVRHAQKASA